MVRSILAFCCLFVMGISNEAKAVEIGQSVLALWEPGDAYFLGTVVEKTEGGYLIVFEDGDRAEVPEDKIFKNNLKVGTAVHAKWEGGEYYPGKIAKIVGRVYYIHYDDGDKGWAPASWIGVTRNVVEP